MSQADLSSSNLNGATLKGAILRDANLRFARLVAADVTEATFSGAYVYGCSFWNLRGTPKEQFNVIITPTSESPITVDDVEVAQFIYLLLKNQKIRHVIDTITSKVVLILGRFTPERKEILDELRDELRKRDYLPILFDFQKPESKDFTGTVTTLANMARFVIADLTDPSSVPHELASIAPSTVVPVQSILLKGRPEYGMFADLANRYHWVLKPYEYESKEALTKQLDLVITPAELKAKELRQIIRD
jgi:hypothetical protein